MLLSRLGPAPPLHILGGVPVRRHIYARADSSTSAWEFHRMYRSCDRIRPASKFCTSGQRQDVCYLVSQLLITSDVLSSGALYSIEGPGALCLMFPPWIMQSCD